MLAVPQLRHLGGLTRLSRHSRRRKVAVSKDACHVSLSSIMLCSTMTLYVSEFLS